MRTSKKYIHSLKGKNSQVELDLRVGHLRNLSFNHKGTVLKPLYTAPWVDNEETSDEEIPVVKYLSGDFLCAPFSESNRLGHPSHGLCANSQWLESDSVAKKEYSEASYELKEKILGAKIFKTLILPNDSPLLYQSHLIKGGKGKLPIAHHVITHFQTPQKNQKIKLFFSSKQYAITPKMKFDETSIFKYPQKTNNLSKILLNSKQFHDLRYYPISNTNEDFIMLVEAKVNKIGWTAVIRENEKDIIFIIKKRSQFPVTMLWFSNGGRKTPPWNGRNKGVLGIEDGRCLSLEGYEASIKSNYLSREGIPTSFSLNKDFKLNLIIGALPLNSDWGGIDSIRIENDFIIIRSDRQQEVNLNFNKDFF